MAQEATTALGWQNKFSTTLSSGITASDTTIPLNALPTPGEGFLVIEPDSATAWEVIYYTSKTGSAVVCTSAANGRGVDDSTAQSHASGATVRMDTVAGMFEVLQNMTAVTAGSAGGIAFASGWTPYANTTPNTVTCNGNRSYDLVFNSVDLTSVLSAGMRLRTTRTSAAPTQCADLESGSSQYYTKSSPNKLTFTDDFVVSAWIKLESYPTDAVIASRYTGGNGWLFQINSSGQVVLTGYNAAVGNYSRVTSYQSVPLNKWVHVAAQLDMSAFTATTTTSYVMLDGLDVPASVSRAGTNPTALVQAGTLEIGAFDGASGLFDGKIAQVAIYNAKVTQANIRATISQGLTGSETSLASAYSFNNSIADLNTSTPNDLTANGSAVATNADSPFGGQADGTISSTLDYAIITKTAFSTNTTLTVQVPEGCTIPTTGGVSAVSYSTQKVPYLFPADAGKWRIATLNKTNNSVTSNATYGAFLSGGHALNVPVGVWKVGHHAGYNNQTTTSVYYALSPTALTGMTQVQGENATPNLIVRTLSPTAGTYIIDAQRDRIDNVTAAVSYVMYTFGATTSAGFDGTVQGAEIFAELTLL